MNDDKMKSSNQNPLNTTHFNKGNVLGNSKNMANYTGIRPINMPRNNSMHNELEKDNIEDNNKLHEPKQPNNSQQINSSKTNLNNNEPRSNSRNYLEDNKKKKENKPRNQFGPKNRINNSVDNLRNALDTNPNLKDEAVKAGAEALKKSANPYAKVAGYAASYMQKRREKKKEKEDKEKEEETTEETENYDDEEQTETEKRQALMKVLLPIIMFIAPFLLILLIILCVIAPILNAYSWFYSIFNHNTDDAESYYIYKDEDEMLEEEKEFNEAIVGSKDGSKVGILQKYKDEYGVTLDKHLLIATVTYKYTISSNQTEESSQEITEEDINKNIDNLDNLDNIDNKSEETNNSNKIDYKAAIDNLETVASLMIYKDGDVYKTDYSVGGYFYNNLIASSFLTSYYKDFLKDLEYETRKELVDKIYDYADGARAIFGDEELENDEPYNGGVISDSAVIHIQTCDYGYTYQTINNMKVYGNPAWNEGTNYPDYLSMHDYLKGVLMGEVSGHIASDYIEGLKAQAVVAFTYIINDDDSGFDLKSGEMYFPAGNCRQLTCSPTIGCTYIKGKTKGTYGTSFIGPYKFGKEEGRNIEPLSSNENAILDQVLNDIFGKIMVKKGVTSSSFSGSKDTIHTSYYDSISMDDCISGKCFGQQEAMKDAANGMTYDKILHKYYSDIDFDIIDINEGNYTEGAEFAEGHYNGKVIYYSQRNYKNAFCGRSDETISSAGCGVTSAAIVASSLTGNKKYDPVYMMEWAHKTKDCGKGISGTDPSFFKVFVEELGFNYEKVGKKDTNKVVNALQSGKALVIAHMGPGHFTTGGHYIVLSAIDSNGKVYVHDPNGNAHTGKWDINLIANELSGKFHIISLK